MCLFFIIVQENPVGSGTGKYKNHRLFYAKAQHASLVPIMGLMKADVYMEMNQGAGAFGAGYQPDYGIFQEPELINSPRSSQTRSAQQNVVQSYNPIQREILPNPVISPERGSYSSNSSSSSHQLMLSKDQIQVHLPPLSPKEKLPPPVMKEPAPPVRQMEEEKPAELGGPNPLYEYTKAQGKKLVDHLCKSNR